ncbi:type IV pilus twitching motility protein PilT [Frigoribacterium sp. Leaf164]|uniref:type IV pilus twitching motility protein PilT n=1 Tax=Frigoribacterium sp. Leaf164 TaxID=1736282 RepID=UPI00269385D1|nr:type IV pilus twitching motility protein PilT [Frigoribacterium sp. Leaf164]
MSVYEIPDEPHAADGWAPGRPGREVSTDTPATSWEPPAPVTLVPASPPVDPTKHVYALEGDQEAVLGWTPTPAPSSRRAARLAEALGAAVASAAAEVGSGRAPSSPAVAGLTRAPATPSWSDPRFDAIADMADEPAVSVAPVSVAPVAVAPVAVAEPTAAPAAAPAPAPVMHASASASAPVPVTPPAARPVLPAAAAVAPPQPQHAAPVASPATPVTAALPVVSATDLGIELHEHARTTAHPGLVAALIEVVQRGASDLHVTVDAAPTLRVDGSLQPTHTSPEPWDAETVASALASLLTPEQQERFDDELELDFAWSLSDESRFRVNFYQQRGSLGAAFRLIPTEIKPLHELGVPESVSTFAKLPRGLVLVTGPTGSGKSTTLAALIDLVNRTRADHIVTVEDPIEFMHQHKRSLVNQREVGHDTHSFAAALKHVLRQDPDVILIGELRDLETISVALTAAETGHLVFATLHTQSAAQTIDRVIDVFPPHQQDQVRTQLASTLRGVVCQTLLPKASGRGRVVATEIMMMTPAIGNLVREGKTYQIASSMQAGRDLGMHTMDQKLADLVNTGVVTHKAAMEKVHDREGFDRLVTRVINKSESQGLDSGIDFGDAFSRGDA